MAGFEGLLTGHTLAGRYAIGEVIGRGGFAAVYEATDERLRRVVAVKVITTAASADEAEEIRKRFDREARASASLHHPNVVSVYDFGTDERLGLDFLVMERLRGEDLRAHIRRGDPFPVPAAVRILREAADGVDAGHRIGLVHRDLKPGNIFLAQLNRADWFRVCVVDFGIARIVAGDDTTRITHHGTPLSPAYASPEQLRGDHDLTPASDVFSLGVIGYELLGGERPFKGDRLHPPPGGFPAPPPLRELNPAVPESVARAIHRALAEELDERFPDAGALAAALAAAEVEMGATPAEAPRPAEPGPAVVAAAVAPPDPEPAVSAPPVVEREPEPVASALPIVESAPEPVVSAPAPAPPIIERAPEPVAASAPATAPPTVEREPEPVRAAAASAAPAGVSVRGRTGEAQDRNAGAHRARAGGRAALAIAILAALLLVGWFAMRDRGGDAPAVATAERGGEAGAGEKQRAEAPAGTGAEGAATPAGGAAGTTGAGAPVVPGGGTAGPGGVQRTPAEAQRIDPGVASPTTTPDRPAAAPPPAPVPAARPPAAPPAAAAPPARVPAAPAAAGSASASAINARGQSRFERGDIAGAVALFRQAVAAAPRNAFYRNNLGWALLQAGDVDGAGRELEETIRLDPRRAIAHANLGEVHAARGDIAAAIAAYERFLELNTDPRREEIARGKLRRLRGGD
ncbi:MAG TPA: protein kinase [Longimicrobium sp.]|nr:protein kinase [Longimicrobium sp.]